MPTNPSKPMMKRYESAQRALEAVRALDGLQPRLRQVGYGPERIQEGEALLAGVTMAIQDADEALVRQRAATAQLRQLRARLERTLRDATQVARATLGEEHPWLEAAGLSPRRSRGAGAVERDGSLQALLDGCRLFFTAVQQAPADVKALLNEAGLGEMAARFALGSVDAVQQAFEEQQRLVGQALRATQVRANAFETLDDWMRSFTALARVALRDRPEQLAAVGLMPRGRPRKT